MFIANHYRFVTVLLFAVCQLGCNGLREGTFVQDNTSHSFHAISTQIEYPDLNRTFDERDEFALPPRTLDDEAPTDFWDITLSDTIALALQNSDVIKDLGGRILSAPDVSPTIYDPAIRASDPLFGTEGALSAFDANLSTSLFWQRNDRALNNITLGGGTREIVQDLGTFKSELTKTGAAGTRMTVRNLTAYDQGNQPGNLFPSAWDTQFEAEVRQPLLQGAGVTFNRIAGPNAQPGFHFSNGVLIARVNTDISIADFESSVRDFISQVEDAYWQLFFAYRYLDATTASRDRALKTWHSIQAQRGLPGGTAEREARAKTQYFQLEGELLNALNGTAAGGRSVGIYQGERRLRRMMGLAVNDGRILRPADEPPMARVNVTWDDAIQEALVRRVELRRQMWKIKRRELELIASKNFTLPRIDGVALYRFRGFGDNLTGSGPRFSSAFQDLGTGDHQEWRLGFEMQTPFGNRQAWAGVRQAELNLARERAVLHDQELAISHGLGNAIGESVRAHAILRNNYNRLNAAMQRLEAAEEVARVDRVSFDLVLESQLEVSESQVSYYESLLRYAVAVKNLHLNKGSLLAYNGIYLHEGLWPNKAYRDAKSLRDRWRSKLIDYRFISPRELSQGAHDQDFLTEQTTSEKNIEQLPIPPTE